MFQRTLGILTVFVVAVAGASFVAEGVMGHGGGGHGYMGGSGMYFDPNSIQTLSGELIEVFDDWEMWGHGNHTGGGMHFEFRADSGKVYELMLAPDWYLEEKGISLSVGDHITVTGSVLEPYGTGFMGGHMGGGHSNDEDYLIATSLTADGKTVQLRDKDGYPVWRGGGMWGGQPWFLELLGIRQLHR